METQVSQQPAADAPALNGPPSGPEEIADEKVIDDPAKRTYLVPQKLAVELDHRFTYHAPHADQLPRYQTIRELARNLAQIIARYTPPSREQALALTKLEECVMHANSAIAREKREDGAT